MEGLKESIITPILKKPSLDANKLNNYRPIANIEFLSKLTEKVVLSRLNEHTDRYNLHIRPYQNYTSGSDFFRRSFKVGDEY